MERLSDNAADIINDLHTERLDYNSEYIPLADAINKLALYEDTKLEPETISKIRDIVLDISGDLDRLRELAQAEKEGRCVVLPCKIGDIVWCIYTGAQGHHPTVLANRFEYGMIPYWGISVFPDKEQAEAALKERENNG